ncbi:Sporulation protein YlmC, PRC-barrel domain family [Neorhodopirellula lusitana]|uniref:Sporulation protein YlmC, PRC-barrel domain family n=1 Tax=Neorhodopirellula lusitana TaxID=445327 RepID=A0ABY1Q4B2_9BACT|nr:PRC-barrel domain-containing protein [Neorhodopirellula lusitana]SMP59242.1 Sporulation protein YlmC, PRC-barrel domain family [Neorhodopirellula lusitana]
MKRLQTSIASMTAIACLTIASAPAHADTANGKEMKPHQANSSHSMQHSEAAEGNASGSRAGDLNAGKLDEKTRGQSIRVSQLIGMDIQNPQGEGVGEINDIVLDTRTGKVRYAAVTYGGLLGVGDKLFAVPFDAFRVQTDPDDRDEFVMVLDVTQQRLEGAKGFDQENWPNFADRNFAKELDDRYGVERNRNRDRLMRGRVDVDVDRNGVDVDVD